MDFDGNRQEKNRSLRNADMESNGEDQLVV